ncbi:F-box/kelch-repeat protein At3g06240-like [Lotus japonicus]|uniref:F-box/kelch-repeat protein At3g06240-like n=1 Tax=Lotus japonicus TaxID=34305 RepID=UPI00258D7E91|nr:F-box/kelch-repeat protein At3g06240-like [Lotus japonicus]
MEPFHQDIYRIASPPLEETHLEGDDIVHSFGFGYDHLTETYKVVAVFFEENELESEIMVHTVGTDYWRRIEEEFPGLPEDNSGKFVSGTINWITFANAMWYVIVSFDLGKESCHQLCLPAELEDGFILGVLRDCLCVFSENDMFCDIWVMKEHGNEESWTKLFSISHDLGRNPPLYISEDDDEVLLPSFSNLVVCNYEYICDMVFKIFDIQNSRVWMLPKILDEPEVYAESLISPCPLY